MKAALFLLALLLIPKECLALNVIISCSSTNIGTSYTTAGPSLQSPLKAFNTPPSPTLAIVNNTGTRICVNTDTASSTAAPTAGNGDEHCVAPQMFAFYDSVNIVSSTGNVYVRADGSSCTSGTVDIDLW